MNKGDDTGGGRLRSAAKWTHTWESGGMDEDTERSRREWNERRRWTRNSKLSGNDKCS